MGKPKPPTQQRKQNTFYGNDDALRRSESSKANNPRGPSSKQVLIDDYNDFLGRRHLARGKAWRHQVTPQKDTQPIHTHTCPNRTGVSQWRKDWTETSTTEGVCNTRIHFFNGMGAKGWLATPEETHVARWLNGWLALRFGLARFV